MPIQRTTEELYTPIKTGGSNVNTPGNVSAFSPSQIEARLPNPISSTPVSPVTTTAGVAGSINDLRNRLAGIDPNIPTLIPPTTPISGAYSPQQQQQISSAGNSIGGEYDSLIRRAEEDKRQGMAKNRVNAGERGGFMNSQFSGIAATTPTVGGDFVGAGGQLERIKSSYDLNIQDLQVKKLSAISDAQSAMQTFIDTGKQQDFNNAQTMYQNARQFQQDQAKAVADQQKAIIDAQKASFDLSVPLSEAGEEIQKAALSQLMKYPDAIASFIEQGGDLSQLDSLSGGQIIELVSQSPSYQAAQQKALRDALGDGSTSVPRNVSSGTQDALQVILGSAKFTAQQAKAITNAISNGEDPLIIVKNQAKALLQGPTATKLGDLEVSLDAINDIEHLLNNYYESGGETGLFKGTIESTVNRLGQVKDPELVEIAVQLSLALQKYRNAISGTAYSDQEGAEIKSVFPGINKSEGLNRAIIEGRKGAMSRDIDSTYRTVLGSAYDKLKDSQGSKVTIAGKQYDVGQEVTGANGQKGIVNADGTITIK